MESITENTAQVIFLKQTDKESYEKLVDAFRTEFPPFHAVENVERDEKSGTVSSFTLDFTTKEQAAAKQTLQTLCDSHHCHMSILCENFPAGHVEAFKLHTSTEPKGRETTRPKDPAVISTVQITLAKDADKKTSQCLLNGFINDTRDIVHDHERKSLRDLGYRFDNSYPYSNCGDDYNFSVNGVLDIILNPEKPDTIQSFKVFLDNEGTAPRQALQDICNRHNASILCASYGFYSGDDYVEAFTLKSQYPHPDITP